jgi:hypothetical protein
VAYTTIFNVDQNFVWPRLLDCDLLIYSGSATLLYYLCPLLVRDMGGVLAAVRSVHSEVGSRNG